jgi:hypothetical protein
MKKGIVILATIVIVYLILKNGKTIRVDMDKRESEQWKIFYQRDQGSSKPRIRLEDIDHYWGNGE